MTATKAAKRSTEEKTRRQRDGVNVEEGREFVIIGLADEFGLIRDRKLKLRFFNPRRSAVSNLFPQVFMVLDAVPPKPNAVPSKVERVILFPSVEAAVPVATMLTSQATRLPLQILSRLESR
jgi:hypothetical protein